MPRVGRRLRRGAVAVVAVVSAGILAGCTEEAPAPPPAPTTTMPLGEIDLAPVPVARAPFCDRLDDSSVADALGGEPRRTDTWESGDQRRVGGTRDVVHEAGCSYARGPTEAAAWVFAAAVSRREARGLLQQRRRIRGCEGAGELAFGRPGEVLLCRQHEGLLVTMSGLFGDAWLTCELSSPERAPEARTLERAQRWCVEVVYAAGAA